MRIPTGNFGNVQARPSPGVRATPAAYGAGVGAAIENVGDVLGGATAAMASDELRATQQAAAEAKARREAADKAQALDQLRTAEDEMIAAHDEIAAGVQTGTVDKTKAHEVWSERRAKIRGERIKDVPVDYQDTVGRDMDRKGVVLDRALLKAIGERDRRDTLAGLQSHMEGQERFAARDPAAAIRSVDAAIDGLGPHAGLDPVAMQKAKQGFRERVAATEGAARVQANPGQALAYLRDSNNLPDMDPDRRLSLIAAADSAVIRQQQRAQIEIERLRREQDRVFAGAQAVFESGRAFSADYAASVQRQLKGSPYEAAASEMVRTGPQNVATATLPIPEQRAQLAAIYGQVNAGGSNPAMNKEIERRQKVLREAEQDVQNDPLTAATERGILPALPPLDASNLAGLPAQLQQRSMAAKSASVWAGRPVSPLTPIEAEMLGASVRLLPAQQQASALAMLGTQIADRGQLAALAKQIDAKDPLLSTAMMYADARTSKGRFVSEIMLRGQQAVKDGSIKVDAAKEFGWKGTIAREIGDAYQSAELRQRAIDAAYFVQAGLTSEGKGDIDQAVLLATGGIREQRDGTKIPLPYGWTEDQFEQRIRRMTAGEVGGAAVHAGAETIPVEQFLAQLPQASLVHAGQGKYVVRAGSGFVTDANGRRLVLDLLR